MVKFYHKVISLERVLPSRLKEVKGKMTVKMVWDSTQRKMVEAKRKAGNTIKVNLDIELYETLKRYAKEDGFDFTGISYETEKDKDGKTKKNAKGEPIFKLDKDGNKVTHKVEVSQGKVNSAVAQYLAVAVRDFITSRPKS